MCLKRMCSSSNIEMGGTFISTFQKEKASGEYEDLAGVETFLSLPTVLVPTS